MKIKKILNNNAVIAVGHDSEDIVITGLGLAFKKRVGDVLEQEKIERVFRMESKEVSKKLQDLISEIPLEYVELSEEIVVATQRILNKKLNENIYLTLTDHIHFAMERLKKGFAISNPMVWEIRRFYKAEYKAGIEALDIIKLRLGVEFPLDEAASIAMHIVNAELDQEMPNAVALIKILQDELNIIKYHYGIELDEDSLYYQRLVTHLKFFAQRILNSVKDSVEEEQLFSIVSAQYPNAYECALKIKKYALEKHDFEVSKAELTYLIVHIEKVIQSSRK
ncbi:BglG family transcription antiterminator LicT [Fusibacter sp. 3D3]|uniref:BglG family transcription antiterminator LicT n=1 Tax=Fusibacter sp. 3D3 TaxID=1048380 RepID=UPI000853146A|nr:PRD domain-containing protein [Fusibacter sp. 3D3]GAU77404.1 beta-glucoside bgl operon antiterminator [Fusibacter sp. 3D3]